MAWHQSGNNHEDQMQWSVYASPGLHEFAVSQQAKTVSPYCLAGDKPPTKYMYIQQHHGTKSHKIWT